MQLAFRSCATAGVVLLSAGMVAISPAVVPPVVDRYAAFVADNHFFLRDAGSDHVEGIDNVWSAEGLSVGATDIGTAPVPLSTSLNQVEAEGIRLVAVASGSDARRDLAVAAQMQAAPVADEPVYCAAIGCRPGEPGYPLGGAEPAAAPLAEISIPDGESGPAETDNGDSTNAELGATHGRASTDPVGGDSSAAHETSNNAATNTETGSAETDASGSAA